MSAIRSIIVVFVLFCWKTSKKFLLTLERNKNPDFDSFFFKFKMLISHNSVAHDLMHVQLLIQKMKFLLKSLFMNISRNVTIIRRTLCIRFK